MVMKKLMISILMSFIVSTVTAPNAYPGVGVAGVLFGVGVYNANHNTTAPNYIGPIFLASWGMMATGFIGILATGTISGTWSTLFFLDADGNLPQSNIEQGLKAKFPFLDNQEVVTNLSLAIKNKYEATQSSPVILNGEELSPILDATDLSSEQYDLIVNELR